MTISESSQRVRDVALLCEVDRLQKANDLLRAANEKLRIENVDLRRVNTELVGNRRALQAILDAHVARAQRAGMFGPLEMTAGTAVGPRRSARP